MIRYVIIALLAVALLSFWGGSPAEAQLRPPPDEAAEMQQQPGGPIDRMLRYVRDQQQKLHRQLGSGVRTFKQEGSFAAIYGLITISFLYGVFHAVGPGHGKAVISSYLLANETEVRRGILLAFASSFVQALSAIALVGVLILVFGMTRRATSDAVPILESASYALIAVIGLYLLWRSIFRRHHHHDHDHGHDHDQDHEDGHGNDHGHHHMPTPDMVRNVRSWPELASIVVAVGIRPCTGAVLVLIFAVAQGIFLVGALATFAMAIGTALAVSALALLTLYSKKAAMSMTGPEGVWSDRLSLGLSVGGSLLILSMGLLLFFASLQPGNPLL